MMLAVLLGLLGAAMGSFAALLAERLVRGEGFVSGGSRCRCCGTALGAAELVPLLSFPLLGGRCRHCQAPIPPVLWQAEIVGMLMGVAAGALAWDPWRGLLMAGWMWSLLALAVADLRWFRLPLPLLALNAALGFGMAMAGDGLGWPLPGDRLTIALAGATAGGGAFWLIRVAYAWLAGRQGMGLGDVLLMAALGLALGIPRLPMVVLLAALSALAVAVLRALVKGRSLRRLGRVPFGAALALAAALVAVFVPY
ncbi:prepilin peptidase [Pararhodobacter aggregans]